PSSVIFITRAQNFAEPAKPQRWGVADPHRTPPEGALVKPFRLGAVAGALLLGAGLAATSGPHLTTETQPVSATQATPESGTIVPLFQWNWDSVAAECADFLGPNGYTGVQVSPPQEHVVVPFSEGGNHPWWQDYQPVSYQIDNTR